MEPTISGKEIKEWRKAKGLSPQDVAGMCSVSASTVYNWELDRNKPHGKAAETLRRLIDGEIAAFPLTPLEDRLLRELMAKHSIANREELLKKLVLDSIESPPGER